MVELVTRVNPATLEGVTARLTGLQVGVASIGNSMAVVGTDINYAPMVVYGSRPHIIRPKDKQALYWRGAQHPVALVHHPGTKPNPFMQDGLLVSVPDVTQALAAGISATIAGTPGVMPRALMAAGLVVQANIQRRAPVKTGTLRRSFATYTRTATAQISGSGR